MCVFDYELFSFNARGINGKLKRNMLFNHLKRKSDKGIFLLQETHSCLDSELEWKREWGGEAFFSHCTTQSAGVAILFSPGLNVTFKEEPTNHPGRTQFIKINTGDPDNETLIVNVYAPTRNMVIEQITFLDKLKQQINSIDFVHLITGGDWNTIFDPKLDKQGGTLTNCMNEYTSNLKNFIEIYELVDVIRLFNPDRKLFTRVQRTPLIFTRLDHWLVSEHLCNLITGCKVQPGIKSDHSIIQLNLDTKQNYRGKGFWKFNSSLLHDPDYVKKNQRSC